MKTAKKPTPVKKPKPKAEKKPPAFNMSLRGTGEVLRELRERKKKSLTLVAEYVGCTKGELSKYENNEVGIPFQRILKIGEALGLDTINLIQEFVKFAKSHDIALPSYEKFLATTKS